MHKSGYNLRQRLGAGDKTIDQIIPVEIAFNHL